MTRVVYGASGVLVIGRVVADLLTAEDGTLDAPRVLALIVVALVVTALAAALIRTDGK